MYQSHARRRKQKLQSFSLMVFDTTDAHPLGPTTHAANLSKRWVRALEGAPNVEGRKMVGSHSPADKPRPLSMWYSPPAASITPPPPASTIWPTTRRPPGGGIRGSLQYVLAEDLGKLAIQTTQTLRVADKSFVYCAKGVRLTDERPHVQFNSASWNAGRMVERKPYDQLTRLHHPP